jgi:hypothetical protein
MAATVPAEPDTEAVLSLTDHLGAAVVDRDGAGVGRLVDLIADPGDGHRPVRSLLVKRDRRTTIEIAWPLVEIFGVEVRLRAVRSELSIAPARSGIHLQRDVLDCQIVDLSGRRVVRAGDVALVRKRGQIRVAGVEIGLAAVLRRLGLRRASRRFASELIDWDELHPLSGRGHALQLDCTAARLHRLDPEHLAELITHIPAAKREDVLERIGPKPAGRVRHLLRHKPTKRRYGRVLRVRRRAPS